MLNRQQAIIWTNADPIHSGWRIYVALWGDELSKDTPCVDWPEWDQLVEGCRCPGSEQVPDHLQLPCWLHYDLFELSMSLPVVWCVLLTATNIKMAEYDSDVTWASWSLKLTCNSTVCAAACLAQKKENIKALYHWPIVGESINYIPFETGQLCGKHFHFLTSSWSFEVVRNIF